MLYLEHCLSVKNCSCLTKLNDFSADPLYRAFASASGNGAIFQNFSAHSIRVILGAPNVPMLGLDN